MCLTYSLCKWIMNLSIKLQVYYLNQVTPSSGINEASFILRVLNPAALDYEHKER